MGSPQHADRGKLGGLKRRMVMRDLALGELSQADIARKYGVKDPSITEFKQRHAEAIEAIRREQDNEYAGILIAQKAARLAALEEIYETAMQPTVKVAGKDATVVRDPVTGDVVYEIDGRAAMQAIKQAAEETGQLYTRVQMTGDMQTTTTYRIEGVDPGDLQ